MQLLSNLAHLLARSPPSADQRPDDSDTLASHAVEEADEPDVRPGRRSRSAFSNVVDRKPTSSASRGLPDTTPAGRSNMRQREGIASDEHRLFPTYGKSQNDVRITPGQTFINPAKSSNTAKSRLQKHAFRPYDRISQKGKDSGPVRAWGKSNVNGHARRSPSPRYPLSSPILFDNESRATKRRHSSGQVIDLDADDMILASSTTGNLPRNFSPSVASVESLEEKEPERNATRVFKVPNDSESEAEEKSTKKGGLTGLRHGTPTSTNGDTIQNEDTHPSKGDIERQKSAAQQQIRDGKQWDSDASESPDELQKDITDRTYPRHVGLQRRVIKSELSLDDGSRSIVKRTNRRQSPNDIRPTAFNSSNRTLDRRQPKIRQPAKSHRHLFEVKFFRYGDIKIEERNMQLFLDEGKNIIGLVAVNQHLQQTIQHLPSESIPVQRVVQVLLGTGGNLKCRLKLSKIEGQINQDSVDIEFGNQRDKNQLSNFLRKKGISLQDKDGNWMDKAFDNVIKIEPHRGKRPSDEVIAESEKDIQVEPVKRQKLSTALQDQDLPRGIKQPPRRVPLPVTQSEEPKPSRLIRNDEDTSIPVKKYQTPSRERETRSKTRQGLVDLVDNEPATAAATKYKAPSGNGHSFKSLVYPREGKKKAEVDSYDLERLGDGEFLNDNLIGFYLRFLDHHLERNNPDVAKRVYFFNSYFFATLTNTAKGKRGVNYEAVQKWTRNVDLFSHDYVVVPINESAHWYLAIICNLKTLLKREQSDELDAPEKNDLHQQLVKKEEIPETPPPERTSTPEESARDSLASMKISDVMSRLKSQGARDSDDEWPEKEENQITPPTIFQNKPSSGGSGSNTGKQGSEKSKKQKRAGQVYSIDQPAIITFDSLGLARPSAVKVLKSYLSEEASAKQSLELDIKDIKGMTAKEIPLQPNYSDCGLYLLAYLEKFVQDPDIFIRKLLSKEMDAEDDWPALKSGLLRRRLRDFLFELHEEQETSSDSGLVDARPISYLLGQSSNRRDGNAESADPVHVAEPEAIPDSIQEEVDANFDSALTYDSSGEAVVRETQTMSDLQHESKEDDYQRIDHPAKDRHGEDAVELPKISETKSVTKSKKSGHSRPKDVANVEADSHSKDEAIFDDMYDFFNQDASIPQATVEVQIPTIQVPGTPPPAKKSRKERVSPRQVKSKKKGL